jgi:hypothetical protein
MLRGLKKFVLKKLKTKREHWPKFSERELRF